MLSNLNVAAFRAFTTARKQALPYRVKYGVVAVASTLFCSQMALSQFPSVESFSAPPIPVAGHDYIQMLNETVNPGTGAVNISINIPTPKGRAINLPVALTYNSNQTLLPEPNASSSILWRTPLLNSSGTGGWSIPGPKLSSFTSSFQLNPNDALYGDGSSVCHMVTNFVFTDINGLSHQFNNVGYIYDNITPYPSINGPTLDTACAASGFSS